jgi:hypothetical protein
MHISHIGTSDIDTLCRQLQLNKILHVPHASKNLISGHRLASDNNVFLEFHHRFFYTKDLDLRNILLKGPCHGGLYPLPASSCGKLSFGVNKVAHSAMKPSIERWHNRLGHPAIPIVQRVVRDFSLPCLAQQDLNYVCDACQQVKSHQLSYPKSTSVSHHPLELIFSHAWGLHLNHLVGTNTM